MKRIIVTTIEMAYSVGFGLLMLGSVNAIANLFAFVGLCVVWFGGEYINDHKFRLVITEDKSNG